MKNNITKLSTSSYIREVKITYKTLKTKRIHVSSPNAVKNFLIELLGNECKENFAVLLVNNKNMLVKCDIISRGTVSEAIVHPREVFVSACRSLASGIIICHNHPSGVLNPSKQDIDTTRRLVECGKIMGIPLMDHIIVGFDTEEYYSMKENGYVPS
jgi:DNA repair protein RadC